VTALANSGAFDHALNCLSLHLDEDDIVASMHQFIKRVRDMAETKERLLAEVQVREIELVEAAAAEAAAAEAEKKATELRGAYDSLRATTEELKATQAQLIHSAKMGAVGQLAAGVAHEINNPMSGVLGTAVNLINRAKKEQLEDDPRWKHLLPGVERIVAAAEQCKAVTENLLALSRQEKSEAVPTNVATVIESTLQLVGAQLRANKIRLRTEIDAGLSLVSGNAVELQQVFTNLILNAQQAMQGEGSLLIATGREGAEVQVTIRDSGKGIPAENITKIFDPFFTTQPPGKGTGLGLSICYQIIEAHHGRIEVESTLGSGTTFTVFLPTDDRVPVD